MTMTIAVRVSKIRTTTSLLFFCLVLAVLPKGSCGWLHHPHLQDAIKSGLLFRSRRDYLQRNLAGSDNNYEETGDGARRNLIFQTGFAALASTVGVDLATSWPVNAIGSGVLDPQETRRIDIFEKVAPSVVFIDTFTERRDVLSTNIMEVPLGTGSGFVWDKEGHIVTNFHVVRDAKFAQVAILTRAGSTGAKPVTKITNTRSTQTQNPFEAPPATEVLPYTSMRPSSESARSVYKAQVVGVDPSKDIAVLKVDAPKNDLFPMPVGTSSGLKVGQYSLAIGNPFGLDHTLTAGIISGIGREVRSPIGRPISNVIQTDAAINPGKQLGKRP